MKSGIDSDESVIISLDGRVSCILRNVNAQQWAAVRWPDEARMLAEIMQNKASTGLAYSPQKAGPWSGQDRVSESSSFGWPPTRPPSAWPRPWPSGSGHWGSGQGQPLARVSPGMALLVLNLVSRKIIVLSWFFNTVTTKYMYMLIILS